SCDLVDPELEHSWDREVVHWHTNYILVRRLQFSDQHIGDRENPLLALGECCLWSVCCSNPLGGDRRQLCRHEITGNDPSTRICCKPLLLKIRSELPTDGSLSAQRAGIDPK